MFYSFENGRLKALRDLTKNSFDEYAILVSDNIYEMASILGHPNATFLLHKKNKFSLFAFAWVQLKARTTKEFKTIIYAAPKGILFYLLKGASVLSFGKYKLIEWNRYRAKKVF